MENLLAQIGDLDDAFNLNGIIETKFVEEGSNSGVLSMLIQRDKKIISGGTAHLEPNHTVFALARYCENGLLDDDFGNKGKILTEFNQLRPRLHLVHILPDNKILVLGASKNNYKSKENFLVLVRYNINGFLDETYGESGKIVLLSNEQYETIHSSALERNTFLILASNRLDPKDGENLGSINELYLKRYDFYGNLDENFGEIGKLIIQDKIHSISIQENGSILLFGTRESGYLISRYLSNGVKDSDFGLNGDVVVSFETNQHFSSETITQEDGKILILGSINSPKKDFALARLNPDGSLDQSFGINGKTTTEFTEYTALALQSDDVAYNINIQKDGKIIVVGGASRTDEIRQNQSIARYNSDGTIDESFGEKGKVITKINNRHSHGRRILFQEDGKIIVGGVSWANTYSEKAFLLTRYLVDLNVGTLNFSLNNSTLIYPNPIQQTATLAYTLENPETLTIQLIDLNGKIIKTFLQNEMQKAGEYQQQIDLSMALAEGVYFLRLTSSNGQVVVKVVK